MPKRILAYSLFFVQANFNFLTEYGPHEKNQPLISASFIYHSHRSMFRSLHEFRCQQLQIHLGRHEPLERH